MNHATAFARLRIVAKSVFASLPRDVRRVLHGTTVQAGILPCNSDGKRREGIAFKNGKLVVLDTDFLNLAGEQDIEQALAHELAHVWRTRTGQHDEDDTREEFETNRVVKSWGFRERKKKHDRRTRSRN